MDEIIASRQRLSQETRPDIEADAADNDGEDSTGLWWSARSLIYGMSRRCVQNDDNELKKRLLDQDFWDLWHTIIAAARSTSANSPAQDRLVAQVLFARTLGALHTSTTSDGQRWADLPFLVPSLIQTWTALEHGPSTQRCNFAAFMARLLATDTCSLALVGLAISSFRVALEQPHTATSVAEDLPVLAEWLRLAAHALIGHIDSPSVAGVGTIDTSPGELAMQSGITSSGLNADRWRYWEKSLLELRESSDDAVKSLAKGVVSMMYSRATEVPSAIYETWNLENSRVNRKSRRS
ncbi:hypothetical protein B0A50_06801 [Salinomyces thailandicus]|uniref:Uncharacterized protein n=1 Tax=Salinomyces thailandicus TaxID=706561 RepID=A0A4U0TQE6_9PEZI|nr:hypothetical protein B0A50_06801 [Salinomyces thailandica]